MPPAHPFASAGFEIDEAAHTLRFTRRLAAPPERVFEAWTRPEEVACWWDAAGERLLRCEIDLRVGGGFIFVTRGHPDMAFAGTYHEIGPPSRLVFDAMGAEGRVLLEPAGGGTAMIVEIACASEEHLRQFVAMGVAAGTSQTMDNLVAHLAAAA
ncbi:MAG TPA: SRPBCC domain-containing protein [Allosphingosinicella sp.]|nr:SRPBCC domain-containing protein [Allosphingosinicella sp.]